MMDLMVHVPKFYFETADETSYRMISSVTGNGILFSQGTPANDFEHKSVLLDMPTYPILVHTFALSIILDCTVVEPVKEWGTDQYRALLRSPDGWSFGLIHLGPKRDSILSPKVNNNS